MNWRSVWHAHPRPRVVALGNFDGVHRGHVQVLKQAVALAHARGLPAAVLTLHPHPLSVLRPEEYRGLLTPLADRARLLARLGIDEGFLLPFDHQTARMSPAAFVDEVLVGHLGVRVVVAGENYHYGHRAEGNADTLTAAGRNQGFMVVVVPPVALAGRVVSASRVRQALSEGDTAEATRLLGRPYSLCAQLVAGAGRGRMIGFPTLNLLPEPDYYLPRHGVYTVYLPELGYGVAHFGPRPTFGSEAVVLEVHALTTPPDLPYGTVLRVAFGPYLRPPRRFPDVAALVEQIRRDKASAEQTRFVEDAGAIW